MKGAYTFMSSDKSEAWLGPTKSREEAAAQIACAEGPSGPNSEYLFRFQDTLQEVHAPALFGSDPWGSAAVFACSASGICPKYLPKKLPPICSMQVNDNSSSFLSVKSSNITTQTCKLQHVCSCLCVVCADNFYLVCVGNVQATHS